MSIVEVNGVRLFCVEEGSGEPVLFVHGVCEDYRAFEGQVNNFSKSFKAISYSRRFSFPNENKGDIGCEDTVENNVSDLVGLIEKLGISKLHLVGHSYGGLTAAYFAFKHPEFLRSLVLVEPGIGSVFVEDLKSSLERFAFFVRHPPTAAATLNFLNKTQKRAVSAVRNGNLEEAGRIFFDGIQGRAGAFDALREPPRTMIIENARTILAFEAPVLIFRRSELRQIDSQTLIVQGETTHKILRAICESLTKYLPNCEITIIPKAGHFSQLEDPDEFNSRVLRFLEIHSKQTNGV